MSETDHHEAPLLRVEGLAAGYGEIQATWDVSFSVWAGHATVVLGRNGAGKTTTLLTIAGLLKAKAGRVVFQGEDVTNRPAYVRTRRGIALVQENKRIFRRRTVAQNILLGGYTLPGPARRAAAEAAYDRFPILGEKRNQRAGALSGGQQQMLAIAQALMPSPKLLLLDEPSAGLAPVVVNEVLATVAELKRSGIGVLLVEQLVGQAVSVADHVVVLDQGRVELTARAGDLVDYTTVLDVYLGRHASSRAPEQKG